ncbi:MAG: hypothetical protein HW390_1473 [Candidatus Brocadiaceae bacterium]|nr:hypothetical protein [Candidatus Brocadiaceae bacterium]
MLFQFHCYKQTAPPGLYVLTSGGIRTVVSHKQALAQVKIPAD